MNNTIEHLANGDFRVIYNGYDEDSVKNVVEEGVEKVC